MIISMQGEWTVSVKSKNAAFDQRFVINGATTGNGAHPGTPGTSVTVTGAQWSIAVQNNPGTGFQLSSTTLKFPRQVGNRYEFEIWSNDAGGDQDFDDLILTCSTPATINDFIIYGHVSLYSGRCIFNPCRSRPYVIETESGLAEALKNSKLRAVLERLYPERIPGLPNPPDPAPDARPIVLDLHDDTAQPRTVQLFKRVAPLQRAEAAGVSEVKSKRPAPEPAPELAVDNFELVRTTSLKASRTAAASAFDRLELARIIDGLTFGCAVEAAPNITLSFEEYDRTGAELAGGAYTGTGSRRMLGDTITDMNGNYIFRFKFDLTVPFLEDAGDISFGEDVNAIIYPDVIAKITSFSPYTVLYESAPYNNIPNLKRIDLCLPKSKVQVSSACFNGNLIGSLGNVFLGGNQNTSASLAPAALRRAGNSNVLGADGKISVGGGLALFSVECAAWAGVIDMKGCMYDAAKTTAQNTIKWYTIRVRRAGTTRWEFVSQNYKHPKFSKRNLPNYIGDDVGPFMTSLQVDNVVPAITVPAYKNIQREIFAEGVDWEFSNLDRFMQLNTGLYDVVAGVTTPGVLHVRVDGYDASGHLVAGATDLIALFIHNLPLNFQLAGPSFADPTILNAGCGLYRLTEAQLNAPLTLSFKANDPHGFVHAYDLTMSRCPGPMLALRVNQPKPPLADTAAGASTLAHGDAAGNTTLGACPGYGGTLSDFSDSGLIVVELQPALSEGGWIKSGESFTVLSFGLSAYKRVTNGYNTGLSGPFLASASIFMERTGS
jgi:hypothetical protein